MGSPLRITEGKIMETILFILLFVGVIGYNLVKEIGFLVKRRFCTVDVSAHIESVRECGWGKHGRLYRATVSYQYMGVRYTEEMVHRYRRSEFYEGESLIVKIDENCPSLFLAKREKNSAIAFLIYLPVFLLLFVLVGLGII